MVAAARTEPASDLIVCRNLVKTYTTGPLEVPALQGLDLQVGVGELLGIVGKSGSGKSTLLHLLAANDTPTTGEVWVAGYNLLALSARQVTSYRRQVIGFVGQQTGRNLLPYLTARQNVEQPLNYAGMAGKAARLRADALLEMVGLAHRARHRPNALSGGEQQRVAIAVALANRPRLLLADEPTGELDSATAREIIALFKTIREQDGVTVVVVTHDPAVAEVADRAVAIRDGRISGERIRGERLGTGGIAAPIPQREYVVIDQTGRLQIPAEYLHTLGIADRALIRLEDGRIILERAP